MRAALADLPAWLMAVRQQHDRNQAAWQRTPEARPGYRPPRPLPRQMRPAQERLYDPNQGVRDQAATQFRAERDVQQSVGRAEGQALGGYTGLAERNQVEEFGRGAMEMTGAPSWARGINALRYNQPGQALPEFGMGLLNTAGLATLPYGSGARAATPPRVPRAPMRPAPALPSRQPLQAATEPPQVRSGPDALGGENQTPATASGPDAGPAQNLDAGAMPALRRELRDHEFDVPSTLPALPEIEVPVGSLRQGQIGALDSADARRYANMGTEAPPILVRRDRNGWHIIDGNRRAAAAQMRGDGTVRAIDASDLFTARTAPDGGPVQAGRDADGAALDLDRLKAEGWDTSRAWARVVPDTAADPWEVRPLGRFGPGLYFGDDVVEGQMTSRVNRIGARQGHSAASHRAYIRDGDMATDAEWREAYRRHSKGPLGERNPRDAEQRAVRDLEQRGFIGVVVRDRNDGSMSLNVFRRENILPVPTTSRNGPNAGPPRPPPIFPGPRNR